MTLRDPAAADTDRARLAQLLSRMAENVRQGSVQLDVLSEAGMARPVGDWLADVAVELGVPIPRPLLAFARLGSAPSGRTTPSEPVQAEAVVRLEHDAPLGGGAEGLVRPPGLPEPREEAGTLTGTGKYYLVLTPAWHVAGDYAGLYNRFLDYQRVVALRDSVMATRSTVFCPASSSMRVSTITEAEERWTNAGLELPIPRRFR